MRAEAREPRSGEASSPLRRLWLAALLLLLAVHGAQTAIADYKPKLLPRPPWDKTPLASGRGLFKVAMTQNGYIQFLRYDVIVPDLHDFTYCLWLRSNNFTYPQPVFSYSRHESERLVRGWLTKTPRGVLVQMAVRERPVMRILAGLKERRWHHLCQGYSAGSGHTHDRARRHLHLDGKLVAAGFAPHARGQGGGAVPGGGDLAVGQEVTDADRGLDDGIEGDVFGFNVVVGGGEAAGRRLARLTHSRCIDGLGAPSPALLPFGARLLVSWPRTPVRVFGGAVMQPARPICGAF